MENQDMNSCQYTEVEEYREDEEDGESAESNDDATLKNEVKDITKSFYLNPSEENRHNCIQELQGCSKFSAKKRSKSVKRAIIEASVEIVKDGNRHNLNNNLKKLNEILCHFKTTFWNIYFRRQDDINLVYEAIQQLLHQLITQYNWLRLDIEKVGEIFLNHQLIEQVRYQEVLGYCEQIAGPTSNFHGRATFQNIENSSEVKVDFDLDIEHSVAVALREGFVQNKLELPHMQAHENIDPGTVGLRIELLQHNEISAQFPPKLVKTDSTFCLRKETVDTEKCDATRHQ